MARALQIMPIQSDFMRINMRINQAFYADWPFIQQTLTFLHISRRPFYGFDLSINVRVGIKEAMLSKYKNFYVATCKSLQN